MEKDRIGIMGVGVDGSIAAIEMAKHGIESYVVDNHYASSLKPESLLPFVIKRMPEFNLPDIDPKAFNYKKHKRTCEKNRRKRKKKRKY